MSEYAQRFKEIGIEFKEVRLRITTTLIIVIDL